MTVAEQEPRRSAAETADADARIDAMASKLLKHSLLYDGACVTFTVGGHCVGRLAERLQARPVMVELYPVPVPDRVEVEAAYWRGWSWGVAVLVAAQFAIQMGLALLWWLS
jgi:hypothetical protein